MFSKCKELSTPPSQTASRDTQNIYQIRLSLGVWVTKSDQVIFEISPKILSFSLCDMSSFLQRRHPLAVWVF